ncbi:hypothetical protein AVEN_129196-1 [Araneus ventricosus]|uniref:Uncharacterized protein n=1 Tax=Araneus ventricosus TaxID=182803 RepID=A0A4Y2HAE3_ARAVE|nr:hypothetical protein AVEN_129196-1 [Araneus ventricosus]
MGVFPSLSDGETVMINGKMTVAYFRHQNAQAHLVIIKGVVVSYSTCSSPQLDQVQESACPQKVTNQRMAFKDMRAYGLSRLVCIALEAHRKNLLSLAKA